MPELGGEVGKMPGCSNPIQCQTAKRELCTCACGGANHSILRKYLDSLIPEEKALGEERLKELREAQATLKAQKRRERRQRRVKAKKIQKVEA